ncbi:hormogonium polysaccharide biosynthesis protein HpsL [Microcoleus sp. FACHB-672]|uniref:hormogonium polysaccharide biosynthesis protein HpsL n=1 Tax=Microcoleus sp. FACHB-672 TaxID=2692825 RepID=UPI00168564DF|nr:hormogonium polysaccharide biosynthesis protein HpsL [Microcoleus sp. FACHB-672]MBD2039666.1 hypothetical protein [Microcoleus sp. FACHB-672]
MLKSKAKSKRKSKKSKQQPTAEKLPLSKKEQKALKRQAARERKEVMNTITPAVFASLAIGILLFLLKGPKLAIAGCGGFLALALAFKYPRQALWAFLIYLPINGTVTYWVGGGNAVFQLAKDALYFPALVALVQHLKHSRLPLIISKGLVQPLLILLTVCILTLIIVNGSQQFSPNPGGKPILLGILGLKVFIGYVPLITCGYYLIRNKQQFLFLTRLHVVLALICCSLGFLQYLMLQTGVCEGTRNLQGAELFKATTDAKCLVGGSLVFTPQENVIRLPGTFVSPWHWAWFLMSNTFLTFGSAFSDPSLLWQIASFASLAAVIINAVICGQRIALIAVPAIIIILLILTGQVANLKRFLPIAGGIGLLAAAGVAIFPKLVQDRIKSFIERWQASPPTEFFANQVQFTVEGQAGLLGKGLGRATNSARALGDTQLIETWFPKLLYEIGPIGLIAFLIFVTALSVVTFKAYRSLKDKNLRSFGACLWVFVLFVSYNPYWYPLDTDPIAVYYWFFAGVILKLPALDRQEQEKLQDAEPNLLFDARKERLKKNRRSAFA